MQAAVHLAWLAQKDEQRRRQQAQAASKLRRLPDWYLHTAALRPRIDSHDFATWYVHQWLPGLCISPYILR